MEASQPVAPSKNDKKVVAASSTSASTSSTSSSSAPPSSDDSPLKRNAEDSESYNGNKRPKVDVEESSNSSEANAVVTPTSTSSDNNSNTKQDAPKKAGASASSQEPSEILDLAETLGLKAGTEIEVQWEIHNDDKKDSKPQSTSSTTTTTTESTSNKDNNSNDNNNDNNKNITLHWWKAKLMPHDGRTTDSVAIRTLHYEARPDLGFPEPSKEDVVFLGRDVLVTSTNSNASEWDSDPDSVNQMPYRRVDASASDEVFFYNEDQLEEQLNTLLMGAFSRNQQAWNALPAAQKAVIAEQIHKKKKELTKILRETAKENNNQIITPEAIQEILAKAF